MEDLTNKKFGWLEVIHRASETEWKCICVCGRVLHVSTNKLINDTYKRCPRCQKKKLNHNRKQKPPMKNVLPKDRIRLYNSAYVHYRRTGDKSRLEKFFKLYGGTPNKIK